GEGGRARARELVRALRAAGVAADGAFEDRPLKAQLRMAARAGARYAAIVGEREAATGTVTLKRLADGGEEPVAASELPARLAGEA
ncbi:MAG TPA: His/Gly/Thr/Pro-type tRNA ligase C-terminal domain-containing protein, partial [Actinomycetota bacterium]|nr:His/Gly/Thr/Pro-type tRNA ligase C-terminal domain-containing protein [Actinomycetota bacterium]